MWHFIMYKIIYFQTYLGSTAPHEIKTHQKNLECLIGANVTFVAFKQNRIDKMAYNYNIDMIRNLKRLLIFPFRELFDFLAHLLWFTEAI